MKLVVFFLVMVIGPAMLQAMDNRTAEDKTCVITSEMLDSMSNIDLEIAEFMLSQAREKSDLTLLSHALSNTANKAINAGDYKRALEHITEALQQKPANTFNLIAMAGESLFHLLKSAYELKISHNDMVAQELYAVFFSYCCSSSASKNNAHPLKNYIEMVLSSKNLNPTYSDWSLIKYCRYLATQYHHQKGKERLLTLINYLIQNGAVDEVFEENEEIPAALACFSLKGGKRPVKGQTVYFKYSERFSGNPDGPGPRGISFKGKNLWRNIMVKYSIDPNPHENSSYNKKQPIFYNLAAQQFESDFQINNNVPEEFDFVFYNVSYRASKTN